MEKILRRFRLTRLCLFPVFFFFTFCMQMDPLMGQTRPEKRVITLSGTHSLSQIFQAIKKQTGFTVFYSNNLLDDSRRVTVNLTKTDLANALDVIFKDLNIKYEFRRDRVIVLDKKAEEANTKPEQNVVVSGQVLDEKKQSLPGVTVRSLGTGKAVMTDLNGLFRIQTAGDRDSLRFSFVGYKPITLFVGQKRNFSVTFEAGTNDALNEVVVVGYGMQKKITTIGAQSSINVEELKQPVANLTNLIAGKVSGIIGVQRSGEPGFDNSEIYIRGISTFTSSSPLVLVDGVERPFSNIDPEDISNFTVLKDASATAVYGVRGANGVILIETRKGRSGKNKITAQVDGGVTQFTKLPQFADGVTYLTVSNEAFRNSNPNELTPRYSQERIEATANGTDPDLAPNVDWFDVIFNKYGNNRRARVNASGGSDKALYYLSVGYYDETGMFKTDQLAKYNSEIRFKRYNFTSNLTLNVTKTTKVDFGASGWISNGNYPGSSTGNVFNAAYVMPPITIPVKYSNGYFSQPRTGDMGNPYTMLTQSGYSNRFDSQLFSNISVNQNLDIITKGLSIRGMFSFDNNNGHYISRSKSVDSYLATGRDAQGEIQFTRSAIGSNYLDYKRENGGSRQFYLESAVNYNRAFDKHQVSGLILFNRTDRVDAFAGDFMSSIPYRYMGLAGRLTYAYDNKYLAEANFGYNGSETFAPSRRFGFFPSFGVGWVASQEKFFEGIEDAVSFLKFRFTYGEVGNSQIGGRRFAYIPTVGGGGGYDYGRNNQNNSIGGLSFGEYAVDVSWERAKKYNLGVELRTWKDAVSLVTEFFREERTGIFRKRGDVPWFAGIENLPWANLGAVNNKGIDATLDFNKPIGKDFRVGLKGNVTWNRAKVIDNAQVPWPYPWQQQIGRKLGQRFGYIALGLFQSDEEIANSPFQAGTNKPGDIKYKDLNGDGRIDSYDQAPIGYGSLPEIVYGFGPTLGWKNWSLGAWFKGISNVDISLSGDGFRPFTYGGERGNLLAAISDRWTPDNPNPKPFYPRITYGADNMNFEGSSWWVKNGAFLRMQTLQLNYEFARKKWLDRVGMSSLDIYFIGYNLATFSGFKLWDVELGDGRGSQYPLLKTYNFGMRANF
ncbi:TonB-dependent receptor [Pararcticibacter amylolyticus]|uniref:SusC/RagA family TonB-linked outer membrane protein n=1 Tax=Pararcticibacter amylolyticus TaxID=2173175 RepID=A0A2U2PH46_9SPHI|nr:TonB-dependent receptor [Pararcticibacter amylolyticus]PWG80582.1 SusC/RagA family TonB-linked outer membrane protein [Pararcticibacter amylolyticus]